jgi:hypothetical protein
MSKEQDNFDDLLKSRLDGAHFEFSESNWEKAEELIIRAEKKRKRRRIGLIFFIGLILGIGLMIPFTYEKGNAVYKKASDAGINAPVDGLANRTIKEVEKNTSAEIDKQVINNKADLSINKAEADRLKKVKPVKENTAITYEVPGKPVEKEMQPKNKDKVKFQSAGDPRPYSREKTVATAVSSDKQAKQDIAEKADKKVSYTKERGAENTKTEMMITGNEIKDNNSIPNQGENGVGILKQENFTPVKKSDKISVSDNLNSNSVNDSILVLKDTVIIGKDSLVKTNAVADKEVEPEKDESFKPSTFLSIDAGFMYSLGWAYHTTKEAAGFNGAGGVSITRVLTKKMSLLAGLQYNSLAHLSYSSYISTNTQYGFGYTETKTIVTPDILHYLVVPVKVQFQLNDKNSLSLGANVLYLLNTSSKVENDTRSDFGTPSTTFATKSGYRDGFANWDIQPALAYRRKLYKAFSVSAEVYCGLIDLKNNVTFGQVKTERNSGLKLTLTFNLAHK